MKLLPQLLPLLLSPLLSLLLLSFSTLHACAQPTNFPYALTFSPNHLTVSRLTASGAVQLARYPLREAYNTYFSDAVQNYGKRTMWMAEFYIRGDDGELVPAPPDTHDYNAAAAMFRDSVQVVDDHDHDPIYASLYIPSAFNWTSVRAALDGVFPDGVFATANSGPKAWGYAGEAACFAYRLDQCDDNLRVKTDECVREDELDSTILVVEYEKSHLHLSIRSIDPEYYRFGPSSEVLRRDFGEEEGMRKRLVIGPDAYKAELRDYLRSFVENARGGTVSWDEIPVAVFVGDASPAMFTELRDLLQDIRGSRIHILDHIDPAQVAAYGAAMYARLTVQRPDLWEPVCTGVYPQGAHNEL